ncbi:MAG: CHASE2 domain-containing protein [Caldimonas sp.]
MFWQQTKVFISYRRDDSAVHAHSLYADLAEAFGKRHVFFDVKGIDYGDDFARILDSRIADCDVVVAVIGPRWATLAGADGQPRIRAPRDYVRHEIASALRTGKRVIPVLVNGAPFPDRAQLPDEVAGLLDLNALTIGDRQLGEDAHRLVDAIRGAGSSTDALTRERWLKRLRWLGLAAALAMLAAAWVALFDVVALDTRTASATLWLADIVAPVAASNDVQVIAIDRQTERVLKKPFTRNPAARRDHAELIRRLAQAGARTVAFDIFIVAPSPADDAVLLRAIAEARAAKTAIVFGAEDIDAGLPVMLPALRDAVSGVGMLCYGERLGYASTAPLASQQSTARGSDAQAGAVGIALATAYPGVTKIDAKGHRVLVSGAVGIREYPYSESEVVGPAQRCKAGSIGDTVATVLYRATSREALDHPDRRIAYETVLSMDAASLRQRFKDKSVLVGLAMPEDDLFDTFHGFSSEVRHGLELHADAAGALLGDRIIQPIGWMAQFATMAGLALLGSRVSQWRTPGLGWVRAAALAGTALACVAIAVAVCVVGGRLVNLTYPLGALAAGYLLATRATESR